MRIKEIDIMKCFAILGIILVHTAQRFKAIPEWLSLICCFGQMGVQVFFVFSAYSLCLSKDTAKGFLNKNYFIKRILRIVPGYWLGIVIYEVLFLCVSIFNLPIAIETNTKPFALLTNLLLVNNLFVEGNNNVVPGGWSISCLWIFYLMFPFIWTLLNKFKNNKTKIALLLLCTLIVPIVFIAVYYVRGFVVENNSFIYFFIGNQITSFLIGIGLFIVEKMINSKKRMNVLIAVASVTCIAFSIFIFAKEFWWSFFVITILVSFGSAGIYILFIRLKINWPEIMSRIGRRTYSMFLLHPLFAYYGLNYIRKMCLRWGGLEIQSVLSFVTTYIIIVIITYIVSGWFEKIIAIPLKWYKNRINHSY